jgi:hypothetical protein
VLRGAPGARCWSLKVALQICVRLPLRSGTFPGLFFGWADRRRMRPSDGSHALDTAGSGIEQLGVHVLEARHPNLHEAAGPNGRHSQRPCPLDCGEERSREIILALPVTNVRARHTTYRLAPPTMFMRTNDDQRLKKRPIQRRGKRHSPTPSPSVKSESSVRKRSQPNSRRTPTTRLTDAQAGTALIFSSRTVHEFSEEAVIVGRKRRKQPGQ